MDYMGTDNGLTTKGPTVIKACDITKQGNTRMNEVEYQTILRRFTIFSLIKRNWQYSDVNY